ncbi:resistance-nodulation-cell division (RND) efflux transporter [Ferrigenium kumadai]|uniref:Resistance-nodulation-cell division (RND) efflux transporter n=1 Tax=Ferrigenium kumadai TaxID=1682490 RepID=A0AAN1VZ45_9PROT|nr:efflux RND transporter permease subunit [Ferrigenium kumadai]BBI98825.1 resistance-nodulation-cell division (RND) efflux transporter [Ferrigenium kumadai]
MKRLPNLSSWALTHQQMVLYLIIVLMTAGAISYFKLGRAEDPDFTFKVMVVRTLWPGASAQEVERELTERIEKKLQETAWVDVLQSASKPGESLVFVILKDYTPKPEVPEAWRQIRKKLDDIRHTLPAGVQGPFPNDEFGDVQINIFALTGDGFDVAALRRHADHIALELRRVPDVKRVELIGVQDEKIYIDVTPNRLASMGVSVQQIAEALQKQNAVSPAGFIETASDRIRLRVSGAFDSVERVRDADLLVNGQHLRLGDIAKVSRSLADPPAPQMRVAGRPAIGLGVVMAKGGNVIDLGENLQQAMKNISADLPAGIDVHVVANQPEVVHGSIHLFESSLTEAILIVLAVSFLSLGWRTGTVVALSIPLVLAITFFLMKVFGIDLQRISLGALVIALGLLVDDAIIAVEMMVVKMEQGWDRFKAATFAYTSTAFPMLTGTLITAAAFTPVGFSKSAASEYTISIFQVVTIALLTSWIVAVVFTPYLGYKLLDPKKLIARAQRHGEDIYDTPFYRRFRALVTWCLRNRWKVILATVLIFILSMALFGKFVQKQFFPSANRLELMVDVWLPQGASLKATAHEVERIEQLLKGDTAVDYYSAYVGNGAPRFVLSLDQQLFADNFGQFVIVTKGLKEREDLKKRLEERFAADDYSHLRLRVVRLENGPPIGYPVQFRVMGDDLGKIREIAEQVAAMMRANEHLQNVNFNWNEKVKSVRVEVDQDKARRLGTSSQEVAQALQGWLNGVALTQYREGDQLIDVVWRGGADSDSRSLERLPDIDIPLAGGRHVPLAQVAKLVPVQEEGIIWRRNRLPTMTVRADITDKVQPATVSVQLDKQFDELRAKLPTGYRIEMGGSIEESAKGETAIAAVMPLMLVGVITLLMVQLQSISRTVMVLLTAPLGLIGVALALLVFRVPFGFVANLGFIALAGMIMRNSVILVDQIRQDEAAGKTQWDAIVGSTVRRFRPIVLTASAAILAMIPLTRQVFWGPMAVSIMGGLVVATLLTCLFLPALYAAWFRVREHEPQVSQG